MSWLHQEWTEKVMAAADDDLLLDELVAVRDLTPALLPN